MDIKTCPKCGREMKSFPDSIELSYGRYETTRWDCPNCSTQRWDSMWEEQERRNTPAKQIK